MGSNGGTFNLTAQLNSVSVYNGSVSNAVSITVILFTDLTSYLSSGAYFTNLWNDGSGGGFAFGYNASTNKYIEIMVDVGSTFIQQSISNVYSQIYNYNTNLLTSGWHSIIIIKDGDNYNISIDGTSSSTLTISGLANNVGLIKWVGGSSSLKNLKLYR